MSRHIYTRRGDDGETGLFSGERIEKTSPRVEAYGTVDELNAALGAAKVFASERVAGVIQQIQERLFYLASELATRDRSKLAKTIDATDVAWLEDLSDDLSGELPPIRNFVVPGGTRAAAMLHLARTICRRAEREIIRFSEKTSEEGFNTEIKRFMNRLSDTIFVLARYANIIDGDGDTLISRDGIVKQTRNDK